MCDIGLNAKLTSFFLVLGVLTFGEGEGEGSSRLGQNQKFFQKSGVKAPLNVCSFFLLTNKNITNLTLVKPLALFTSQHEIDGLGPHEQQALADDLTPILACQLLDLLGI